MELIFQSSPSIIVATNTFINVPTVLKYEDTPLIEVIKEQNLGFTTQIPIYHSDGTYLAKVKGNRVYPTEAGKKANLEIRDTPSKFICSLDSKVVFELSHGVGQAFKRTRNCTPRMGILLSALMLLNQSYSTYPAVQSRSEESPWWETSFRISLSVSGCVRTVLA